MLGFRRFLVELIYSSFETVDMKPSSEFSNNFLPSNPCYAFQCLWGIWQAPLAQTVSVQYAHLRPILDVPCLKRRFGWHIRLAMQYPETYLMLFRGVINTGQSQTQALRRVGMPPLDQRECCDVQVSCSHVRVPTNNQKPSRDKRESHIT